MPLLPILSAIWSFASSQIGVVLIVGLAAFGYGHHRASVACDERIAAAHTRAVQLHLNEVARQAKAAETIALADRNRAAEASKAADAMQAEIDALKIELAKKVPSHEKADACAIDADLIKRLQRVDRSGRR